MLDMVWPIFIIVLSNCIYHVCSKSVPNDINPFATLIVTYVVAAVFTFVLFVFMTKPNNILLEFSNINWASIVLGISIVGLEFGSISMYRVGWDISKGSLVANICLACSLAIIGFIVYKEDISVRQILGMIICVVGLVLVSK